MAFVQNSEQGSVLHDGLNIISVHHDFIHEEPGRYGRVTEGHVTYIACGFVAYDIEVAEDQMRVRGRNVIETLACRSEIPAII